MNDQTPFVEPGAKHVNFNCKIWISLHPSKKRLEILIHTKHMLVASEVRTLQNVICEKWLLKTISSGNGVILTLSFTHGIRLTPMPNKPMKLGTFFTITLQLSN